LGIGANGTSPLRAPITIIKTRLINLNPEH
jgi:hypothetical protein